MRQQGDRVFLTFDEACSLLPDNERVHTFTNPGVGLLLGADWDRAEIIELMRSCPDAECAEVTGPQAQAVGHGIVVHRAGQPLLYVEASDWASRSAAARTEQGE